MSQISICALYKFVRLEDFACLREPLLEVMSRNEVRGTLLLAEEGINGTIAGTKHGVEAVCDFLQQDTRLAQLSFKYSYSTKNPFYRSKVKLKKEIVTMGVKGIDPRHIVGTYVKPQDWNELISDPNTLLVDTRNDYEVGIGTFKNALNPQTKSFKEFPEYAEKNLDMNKHKKIAMFCTGGIRCEKSTAYLKEQGFENVFHLEGGILKYLEEVPSDESLWQGECFVFDGRVAVNHELQQGQYDQCFACRYPVTEADKNSPHYVPGVSCQRCYDKTSEDQRHRFNERERQIKLAQQRGEDHIGGAVKKIIDRRRQEKRVQKEQSKISQG